MRIVAGEFKGRVIESPSEKTTRPTTDRVRESIFSSVYSRIPELDDIVVLDAFAGSGALGVEAISRGACRCIFLEQDKAARAVIEKNLGKLGLKAPKAQLIGCDSFDVARYAAQGPFGLVLLDPPYAYEPDDIAGLLAELVERDALEDACVIVYEHALANKDAVAEKFGADGPFELTGQKKYGKIGVSYMKYRKGGN